LALIDDYAPTAGPTRAAVDEMDGNQPGDPERAAAAVVEIVNAPEAPLRLALGDDAVDSIPASTSSCGATSRVGCSPAARRHSHPRPDATNALRGAHPPTGSRALISVER
jgi:hypothetical protein